MNAKNSTIWFVSVALFLSACYAVADGRSVTAGTVADLAGVVVVAGAPPASATLAVLPTCTPRSTATPKSETTQPTAYAPRAIEILATGVTEYLPVVVADTSTPVVTPIPTEGIYEDPVLTPTIGPTLLPTPTAMPVTPTYAFGERESGTGL